MRLLRWIGSGSSTTTILSLSTVETIANSSDIGKLGASLFTNPASILIFVVELFLGIGLGYVALKALKYILAFTALIVFGVLLNVWQAPQLASQLGIKDLMAVSTQVLTFAYSIGLTTVLPLTLGFIIGAFVGVLK